MQLDAVIASFLDARSLTCSRKTLALYQHVLSMYRLWCAEGATADLHPATITAYLRWYQARDIESVSVQNHYRILRNLARWAYDQELIDRDPFAGRGRVPFPSAPRRYRSVWSDESITAMLACSQQPALPRSYRGGPEGAFARDVRQSRVLLLWFLDTATRNSEAAQLTCGQIRARRIVITGKGGHERPVFVSMETKLELVALAGDRPDADPLWYGWKGYPMTDDAVRGSIARLAARAVVEIPPRPVHALRHYVVRRWQRAGVPTATIQQLLGHASITTTQLYTGLDESQLELIHQSATPVPMLLRAIN